MVNRKRSIQKKFYVDEEELKILRNNMDVLGASDFSEYIRKVALTPLHESAIHDTEANNIEKLKQLDGQIGGFMESIDSAEEIGKADITKLRLLLEQVQGLLRDLKLSAK